MTGPEDSVARLPQGWRGKAIGRRIGTVFLRLARARRSGEPRLPAIVFDATALAILQQDGGNSRLRIIASEPIGPTAVRSDPTGSQTSPRPEDYSAGIFLEVSPTGSPASSEPVTVHGVHRHGYHILQVASPHIAQTIAAVALRIRDTTGRLPRIDFAWPRSSHAAQLLRFLLLGTGQIAPTTREILRRTEPDAARRPKVHVGS